jgi:hypothetical protein
MVCLEILKRRPRTVALGRRDRFHTQSSRCCSIALCIEAVSPPVGTWNGTSGSTPKRPGSLA